jgi:hypothetical protein
MDITEMLSLQRNATHYMYRSAIENNYSHEQMTPLNLIQTHSTNLLHLINAITTQLNSNPEALKLLKKSFILTKELNQCSRAAYFYNMIQITKMKINNGTF